MNNAATAPVLNVNNLSVVYGHGRHAVHALTDVSLSVPRGSTVGVVGESGSGKSTLARTIMGMVPAAGGQVVVDGLNLLQARRLSPVARARRVQMIFQDPHSSLNPRMRIGEVLGEALTLHSPEPAAQRKDGISELLTLVHLEPDVAQRFPYELSGGMRQRVAIARALAVRPQLIVADEITSALDASVQGVVLNLLRELQRSLNLSVLFISHNLAAVRYVSPSVVVMHHGRIVEAGDTEQVVRAPRDPYTQGLIAAIPQLANAGTDVLLHGGAAVAQH